MADLRIDHGVPAPLGTPRAGADQRRGGGRHAGHEREPRAHAGAEELAVALGDSGHAALTARFEQGADGNPHVRVVDRESGETVALLTPDELRDLAEQTGLPA